MNVLQLYSFGCVQNTTGDAATGGSYLISMECNLGKATLGHLIDALDSNASYQLKIITVS